MQIFNQSGGKDYVNILNSEDLNANIIPTLKIPKVILNGQSNRANSRPASTIYKAKLALRVRKPKSCIRVCLSVDTLDLATALSNVDFEIKRSTHSQQYSVSSLWRLTIHHSFFTLIAISIVILTLLIIEFSDSQGYYSRDNR